MNRLDAGASDDHRPPLTRAVLVDDFPGAQLGPPAHRALQNVHLFTPSLWCRLVDPWGRTSAASRISVVARAARPGNDSSKPPPWPPGTPPRGSRSS